MTWEAAHTLAPKGRAAAAGSGATGRVDTWERWESAPTDDDTHLAARTHTAGSPPGGESGGRVEGRVERWRGREWSSEGVEHMDTQSGEWRREGVE